MKRNVLLAMAACVISLLGFGQISGIKTIPGDYATVATAINALNTSGVGPGGVTFKVAPGYIETFLSLTSGLITASGTASNPVVFMKDGTGINPMITACNPGTGNYDYIFCIGGGDYITFDGIDVQENAANTVPVDQMEFGFAIFKASGTDGAQHITIKNSTINMSSNSNSYGIYSNNYAYAAPGSILTVTSSSGTNSYNRFYGLTFNSCYNGIYLYGFADVTPFSFYDQGNEVGKDGANSFRGLGYGGTTNPAFGLNTYYQNGMTLANNSFTGAVPLTSGSCSVFNLMTGLNSNLDVYSNTISMTYNGTGSFYAIYNNAMGGSGTSNAVNYYNNSIVNNSLPNHAGGTVYLIWITTGGVTANFYGNLVSGNTIGSVTATSTGPLYYSYFTCNPSTAGTANVYSNTVSNNIRIQSTLASATTYMFYNAGTGNVCNEYNNTIENITVSTSGIAYGFYSIYNGVTKYVYNNRISNIYNTNYTTYGMYNGGGGNGYYYNNRVQNINMASGTALLYGIFQASGNNVYYYNNFVSELKAPTSGNTIYGLYMNGGTSLGAYNNTIYLDATSTGTNFGATGIFASATPAVELRNNIVVNKSASTGTGRVIAYQRNNVNLTSYVSTSNNNDFWAGAPGPNNLIFADPTNSDQSLAAYKARVSPRDASAVTENPPFISVSSTPYDLHIQTTTLTQCESGGATVAIPVAVTTDYDGNSRYPNSGYPNNVASQASAPDIGADEFGGLAVDLTPPNISFTQLMNTSSTIARVLSTTITDATGVPVLGAGLPVIYWKVNSGAWSNTTGVWAGGNTYTFTFGSGVFLNDVVSYYIVAQDIATIPNVGSNPLNGAGGFTFDPPFCSIPPTTPYSYTIVGALSGVYPVGTGQVYPSLTAAISDLNIKEVVAPVTFELWDATYSTGESFPLTIYPYAGASAANTVSFKPKASVSATVTGSSGTGLLVMNGCQFITIDGSNSGGNDKNLAWENTNASNNTYTLGFLNNGATGASNCTIKNCILKASPQLSNNTYGIFLNQAGGGYSNIVIDNNSIFSARYGIQFGGISGTPALNGQITNNIIGTNTDASAIKYCGILVSQADNTLIQGNEIMGAPSGNANSQQSAVWLSAGATNTKIRKNSMHDFYYTGTSGYGTFAIYFNTGDASTPTEISSNLMYNFRADGWTSGNGTPAGIQLYTGGNARIYHNSIYLSGNCLSSARASYSSCISVCTGAVAPLDIRDNILKNSMQPVSGTANLTYGIYSALPPTAYSNLDFNNYFIDGVQPNIGYIGGNQSTLTAWQTATGKEASGKNADPLFISATDLHSQQPLLIAGFPITGLTTDFSGITRTNPPSIGAYELPQITTSIATSVSAAGATLTGSANGCSQSVATSFEYGLSAAYGNTAVATPAIVTGTSTASISLTLSGLSAATLYHYRATGTSGSSIYHGSDMTFVTAALVPENITIAGTVTSATDTCYNATSTITVAGGDNIFEVQAGGSATFIAGGNILYYAGTMVHPGGYMHGYITLTNNYCSAPVPPMVAVKTGMEEAPAGIDNLNFKLYPNPTNGNFTLVQKSSGLYENVNVEIFSMHGEKVLAERFAGEKMHDFVFSDMATGLYFVKIVADGYVETIKLVKL